MTEQLEHERGWVEYEKKNWRLHFTLHYMETHSSVALLSFPDGGKGTKTSKAAVYSDLQKQIDIFSFPACCPLHHSFLHLFSL